MDILITGGTGTVGQALTKALGNVRIMSRNESAQIAMGVDSIVGDVRDYQECLRATQGIHTVYHLAAMKHVGRCEEQPQEALKTNAIGTMNMINASVYNGVKEFIHLSTDKVVNPSSAYGATKLLAEQLVINGNRLGYGSTRFSVVRSGNIMGSSNSVIPLFISQLKESNKIFMTCGEMTRFFIYLPDLIAHMTSERIKSSCTFIPQMNSFNLWELAQKIISKYGNKDSAIIESGMLPGEKLHEILFTRQEMPRVRFDGGYWIGGQGQAVNEIQCSMDNVVNDYTV